MTTADSLTRLREKLARIQPPPGLRPAASASPRGEAHWHHDFHWHHYHGNVAVDAIGQADGSPCGVFPPPQRWAFLDTETTGISGGTGTYAFLIGIGVLVGDTFRIHQFFLRDFHEEPDQLAAVDELLQGFDVLVTYNGKSFDGPRLDTRYRLVRREPPHERLLHFDLLHSARRIWKLRMSSCRLVELESAILGFQRQDDVPGYLIPPLYFDYLRYGMLRRLDPVFLHNRLDILSLACLTSVVLAALGDPARAPLTHGADLYSLARWVSRQGRSEAALDLLRRALRCGLPPDVESQARWEMAAVHKRMRDYDAALPLWRELGTADAFEEIAKYYEHRAGNVEAAAEAAREALRLSPDDRRQRRVDRLERKTSRRVPQPLTNADQYR